jgi:hypothetical protein
MRWWARRKSGFYRYQPNGSRSAAERVLSQLQEAVLKGSEELADSAAKWWLYDKQLYHLKRIARTERSTALHRAVIAGSEDDETIIGYQWRLSGSHPAADICDYYANIEMGLGKGVWSKDTVPRHKAHPHCMCLLIPRVTEIRQKGSNNYAEFISTADPERRDQLLPKWAKAALSAGTPLQNLIRPDGLGLIGKASASDRGLIDSRGAYDIAKAGGANHGWYLQQLGLDDEKLEKGIRSYQKQIAKHRKWPDNPREKISGFDGLHPNRQRNLIEHKWPGDIQRHQDQMAILNGILKARKNDNTG